MNPCFNKLWADMISFDACASAKAAVMAADDWSDLCAHDDAADWALWLTDRVPTLASARKARDEAIAPARKAYDEAMASASKALIAVVREHYNRSN